MQFKNHIVLFLDWVETSDGSLVSTCYVLNSPLGKGELLLRSKIWFTLSSGKMRVYRFEILKGKFSRYSTDKEAMKILKSAKLVGVSVDSPPPNVEDFLEFVKAFNLPTPKKVKICPHCLRDREKVTPIAGKGFDYYGTIVCRNCALKEVRDDYRRRGIEITSSASAFFKKQLQQTHNVKKSVAILESGSSYKKIEESETLFDVIKADNAYKPMKIDKFLQDQNMNPLFVKHWKSLGIKTLLPVQQIAIKEGLLEYQDLLVVAGTSSGKTFVGELAGLNILDKRKSKFVFLTPLVALTNQKYEQFKRRYKKLGFRVGVRVGMSKIDVGEENKNLVDTNFHDSDIIVGTYEAFDWIIRSGNTPKIGEIGTLVIDEVQLLGDGERGQMLDGLINRVRMAFPNCQIVCLSATIGNVEELAGSYGLKPIEYTARPVPLERHIVITDKPEDKEKKITQLLLADRKRISSHGHPGRSLVFTNTRRRAQQLATILRTDGIKSTYYHAGMTFQERKAVERRFEKGEYDVITTTAALGAGVDFAVSQVIFEVPAMGARWLKVSEFYQMVGRAGRFGYHDIGRTYLFVTPGSKIHNGLDRTEDQVAFSLLTDPIEDVDVEISYELECDQVLSEISASKALTRTALKDYYKKLFYGTNQLETIVENLKKLKMVNESPKLVKVTSLGRATSQSFLTPQQGYRIASESLKKSVRQVAIEISPFRNIYLSPAAHAELEQATKVNLSTRLLSDGVIDAIFSSSRAEGRWTKRLVAKIKNWMQNIFVCNCKEKPYCDHAISRVSEIILNYRVNGYKPKQITNQLLIDYNLFAYPGDIYSWLDEIVHSIEAIQRLARAMKRTDIVGNGTILAKSITRGKKITKKKEINPKQTAKSTKGKKNL